MILGQFLSFSERNGQNSEKITTLDLAETTVIRKLQSGHSNLNIILSI